MQWTGRSTLAFIIAVAACRADRPPSDVVPESSARSAAVALVPGARVKSHELEHEDGRWVYSYDLEVQGRPGVEEVQVDARTGAVVKQEHESAEQERAEAADESDDEGAATTSSAATSPNSRPATSPNPAPVASPYHPALQPSDFVAKVDNPYFPLTPGTVFTYRNANGERNVVTVTDRTKTVMGIRATVVMDREYDGDELAEETADWYAQDRAGNVWYLGEDSREMEDGRVASTSGSWEAGRDGAQPGILMLAEPRVGERYRQEYLKREAEDVGEVVERGVGVTVPAGSYSDCVRTADTSPLEPDARETKVYCRGVGLVQENEGPKSVNRLVAIERP